MIVLTHLLRKRWTLAAYGYGVCMRMSAMSALRTCMDVYLYLALAALSSELSFVGFGCFKRVTPASFSVIGVIVFTALEKWLASPASHLRGRPPELCFPSVSLHCHKYMFDKHTRKQQRALVAVA